MPGLSVNPRKSIDCRLYPSEKGCTLKISGTEEEVLEAAAAHAVAAHGHANTPELMVELRALLKTEPAERPAAARRAARKKARSSRRSARAKK
jgi:hypothetical protein